MKCFTPEPREFYCRDKFGLGNCDFSDVEWNLAALSSRALYAYEKMRGEEMLLNEFDVELSKAIRESLTMKVGGVLVSEYMERDTPFDFLTACDENKWDVEELPLCRFWGDYKGFMVLLTARCHTWLPRRVGNKITYLSEDARDCIRIASHGQ